MNKEMVNHPDHYNTGDIECITAIRYLPFSAGSAVKYLWRYEHKQNPIQDLQKARWYINQIMEWNDSDDINDVYIIHERPPREIMPIDLMAKIKVHFKYNTKLHDIITLIFMINLPATFGYTDYHIEWYKNVLERIDMLISDEQGKIHHEIW